MFVENLIPSLMIAVVIIAICSVALVQIIFGRKDLRLSLYSFVFISFTASTLGLKWLEGSGQIHSNQDNTSIFLFICALLTLSVVWSRHARSEK